MLCDILNTAANDDELIQRNPCRIQGAGDESPDERPVLTTEQVFALSDRMPKPLLYMVLLTTFASLRYGEAFALNELTGISRLASFESMNSALFYWHATAQADRHIADQLDAQIRVARKASLTG